jgi:hypothetical protein
MVGNLYFVNILQLLIEFKNISPKIFIFLVIKEFKFISKIFVLLFGRFLRRILGKIYCLKFVVPSKKDLMSEVQENFSEDHKMPMIRSKIYSLMFAGGCMRSDQDIV